MSELRQDLVSGDWIILAPERDRRPHLLGDKKKSRRRPTPKSTCPFEPERLKLAGNWPPVYSYPEGKNWEAIVIPNKYPALRHSGRCSASFGYGPHQLKTGAGVHELVITREHSKSFADLDYRRIALSLGLVQKRYKDLASDKCNIYTSTWFNWGASAGASVYHPHYQMLTLPIVPPDIAHSIKGAKKYFKEHKKCVHCVMLGFDLKEKKRIICQNRYMVAVAPFISRAPFEVRIFPKEHAPYFDKTSPDRILAVAEILKSSLKRIRKYLGDPDFNFFIHTPPLKDHRYNYYHWHIEIIPKISIPAGFELGTGVEINVVDPDKAAKILRGKNA